MDAEWIIAALAFMTIGGVLAVAIFHFGFYLKDPKNMAAAKAVADDRESAATRVSSEGVNGRSLRQRLNEAPALKDRLSSRYVGSLGIGDVWSTTWPDLRAAWDGKRPYR